VIFQLHKLYAQVLGYSESEWLAQDPLTQYYFELSFRNKQRAATLLSVDCFLCPVTRLMIPFFCNVYRSFTPSLILVFLRIQLSAVIFADMTMIGSALKKFWKSILVLYEKKS
jgi:hypothetical protein